MAKKQCNCLIVPVLAAFFTFSSNGYADTHDPLEPVNRVVFKVNDKADRWLIKPVAKTYRFVMPEFAERGVRNFFSNVGEVRNSVHNLLQGKGGRALKSTGRFAINSTVGVAGFFDVATRLGIEQSKEDLGQTLGVWGVGTGPYLVLPLLGPSTLRDSAGLIVDPFLKPQKYFDLESEERLTLITLNSLQRRADFLGSENMLSGDAYTMYREAYLSIREFQVNDGRIKGDEFTSEAFSDDEFLDEEF